MSREAHVRFREKLRVKFSWLTRRLLHCKTEQQAQLLLAELKTRFAECELELHPDKTKIIYCKDANRKNQYPIISFDFLGYTFRPRSCKNSKRDVMFVSFMASF